jgi:hypothetical protein
MPDRTTIVMPEPLKRLATAEARRQGISFGELVRRAVEKEVSGTGTRRRTRTGDPFWDNMKSYDDAGPADASTRIDELLYGDPV